MYFIRKKGALGSVSFQQLKDMRAIKMAEIKELSEKLFPAGVC
jgi:hypothetical protein